MTCGRDETRLCHICLAATTGIGPRTHRKLISAAESPNVPLRSLLDWRPGRLISELGLDREVARRISGIEAPVERGQQIRDELADEGIRAVAEDDSAYPDRLIRGLGRDAPPVLFLGGNPELLTRPAVAVVGSRSPSRGGENAATRFAARMAEAGWIIVSGGARGIDTAGHHGALKHGATAAVPPRGLLEFRWRSPARSEVNGGEWCMVGQFPPRSGWKTEHALMRNHTIVALSDATLAVEPRDRGGTWRSSRATLRAGKPLLVMNGSEEQSKQRGAEILCRSGAQLCSCNGPPGPEQLERIVEGAADAERHRQRSLFDRDEAY